MVMQVAFSIEAMMKFKLTSFVLMVLLAPFAAVAQLGAGGGGLSAADLAALRGATGLGASGSGLQVGPSLACSHRGRLYAAPVSLS